MKMVSAKKIAIQFCAFFLVMICSMRVKEQNMREQTGEQKINNALSTQMDVVAAHQPVLVADDDDDAQVADPVFAERDFKQRNDPVNPIPNNILLALNKGDAKEVGEFFSKKPQLIESLILYRLPLNKGITYITPLIEAVKANRLECANLLLTLKAQVNAIDSTYGHSALMWGISHSVDASMIKLLLDHGAIILNGNNKASINDLIMMFYPNNAPQIIALFQEKEKSKKEQLLALKKVDESIKNPLLTKHLKDAIERNERDVVENYITHGGPIESCDANKCTMLMLAVKAGHLDLAKYLLAKGAAPSATDSNQLTVMHYATMTGRDDIVKELVPQWISRLDIIFAKDKSGLTPQDYANKALLTTNDQTKQQKIKSIIEYLKQFEA